jgi:hypothetical protein
MFKELAIIFSAFVLSFLDCFIVGFVPPVSPTIGLALQTSNYIWIMTLICGITVGIGTTTSLWFFRTAGYKFIKVEKFKNLERWQRRISVFVNHIGYYIIIPFAATSLTMAVSVTFLLSQHVDYKKFLIYMTAGRTLILFLFVASMNYTQTQNIIPIVIVLIVYVIIFSLVALTFYRHRSVITFIREEEKLINENMSEEERAAQLRFKQKLKFWKRG